MRKFVCCTDELPNLMPKLTKGAGLAATLLTVRVDRESICICKARTPYKARQLAAKSIIDNAKNVVYRSVEIGDKKIVIAMMEKNGSIVTGTAVWCPGDKYNPYDPYVGHAIAYLRAAGEPIPSILMEEVKEEE